jgi:tetratricopeptide (TPR) repeat protein
LGEHSQAMRCFQKSQDLYEAANDESGIAATVLNIGHVHLQMKNLKAAIDCYHDAFSAFQKIGNRFNESLALNCIAIGFEKLKSYPNAFDFNFRALDIQKEIGDKHGESFSLRHIGKVCFLGGDAEQARHYLQEGLALAANIGDKFGMAESLHTLAQVAMQNGESEHAVSLLQKSIALYEEMKTKSSIGEVYETLINAYQTIGAFDKVKEAQKASRLAKNAALASKPVLKIKLT